MEWVSILVLFGMQLEPWLCKQRPRMEIYIIPDDNIRENISLSIYLVKFTQLPEHLGTTTWEGMI